MLFKLTKGYPSLLLTFEFSSFVRYRNATLLIFLIILTILLSFVLVPKLYTLFVIFTINLLVSWTSFLNNLFKKTLGNWVVTWLKQFCLIFEWLGIKLLGHIFKNAFRGIAPMCALLFSQAEFFYIKREFYIFGELTNGF